MNAITSEAELVAVARALAGPRARYTVCEKKLFTGIESPNTGLVKSVRALIEAGADPLGEIFCQLRSPAKRRASGAVYTPFAIIQSMIRWAAAQGAPRRIVDAGCGSGRFTVAAAQYFRNAALLAVDTDPLAVLMLRANAAVLGLTQRLTIHCGDYRRIRLPEIDGRTLFIGNPPYVRHHGIEKDWKTWFAETAAKFGFKASKLAGLHLHFFLKTRQLGRPGDYGAFITSAEWLDVNYGAMLRAMLADGLGGAALHVLSPRSMPFPDAATTGAITCFRIGQRTGQLVMRAVESLDQLESLSAGKSVPWSKLEAARRWTTIISPLAKAPRDYVELGEFCRVHRGQVTGSNGIWIAGAYPEELPEAFLFPTVTKARELIGAGEVLCTTSHLRHVIDLPVDLDVLNAHDRDRVERFLTWAKVQGADKSYIASMRRAWWSVKLRAPAPILCTYMARRPPAFVRNLCAARHINIAHGLYPREPLTDAALMSLVVWLNAHITAAAGRTYAGGLIKFEPGELERVLVPKLETLQPIPDLNDNTEPTEYAADLG